MKQVFVPDDRHSWSCSWSTRSAFACVEKAAARPTEMRDTEMRDTRSGIFEAFLAFA